jgi:hypothetical protein
MNCALIARLGVFTLLTATAACAVSSSPNAEAVSAGPVAPAPPIASERSPSAGVPTPQAPAAVTGPAATVPTPIPAAVPSPVGGYSGADPCQLATKGDSPVAKACREGGIKSAKAAMKELVKGGRAAGVRYQCDDCHLNDADYAQLTKGAEDKFAKLLAANRK